MRSFLIAAAIALSAAPAAATVCPATPPTCASLSNPIYLQTGDTQLNLMKRLARLMRDNSAKPVTMVFATSGSCVNIDNFYHHTAPIKTAMQWVPSIAEDPNWLPSSATCTCTPDPTNGVLPDIGNSALFISSCTTETPPTTVNFTNGPIQAYVMAVPKASDQIAITFEEAYFVFGFGMAGMVQPWVDETQMFIRTTTKSTLLTWAANIAVPANKWKGVPFDTSPLVESALINSTKPENAIGILGVEVFDADRATLTELAFRAKDQYAAYFTDSTQTSRDKQNVRDGHYTVWSPTVWMINVDATNNPVKPDAKYIVDLIAGLDVTPAPNFDSQTAVARVGLVPNCAMRVTRDFDGGPLSLYKPAESCTCKFLADVDISPCATCDATHACTGGTVCRNNYCEEF